MTHALIAHSPQDAAHAVGICQVVRNAKPILAAPFEAAQKRAPLMLLWSRNAIGEGAAWAAIAIAQQGPVCICRVDDAALDAELAELNIVQIDGELSGREFARASVAAFVEARRRGPVRRREQAAQGRDWAFAAGMARGFASSVAVLGLGSVAAVGAADKVDGARAIEDVLSLFGAPSQAVAAESYDDAAPVALPSHEGLRSIVASMQQRDDLERTAVIQRLNEVETDLAVSEEKTGAMIDKLQSLSHPANWSAPPVIDSGPLSAAAREQAKPDQRVSLEDDEANDDLAALWDPKAGKSGLS